MSFCQVPERHEFGLPWSVSLRRWVTDVGSVICAVTHVCVSVGKSDHMTDSPPSLLPCSPSPSETWEAADVGWSISWDLVEGRLGSFETASALAVQKRAKNTANASWVVRQWRPALKDVVQILLASCGHAHLPRHWPETHYKLLSSCFSMSKCRQRSLTTSQNC